MSSTLLFSVARPLHSAARTRVSLLARAYSVPSGEKLVDLKSLSELAVPTVPNDASVDQHISVLTLNRPASKNAISRALLNQLDEHVSSLRASKSSRVVLLRSSVPGTFCAGADLKERKGMSPAEVDAFLLQLRNVFTTVSRLPMPVIACLDGLAMGGGLELALCADLRIAGPSASRLGLTETKLGIIPGAGGTSRITRIVGVARAKELIFSARLVDALEAQRIGLVDFIAPPLTEPQLAGQEAFVRAIDMSRSFAKNGMSYTRSSATTTTHPHSSFCSFTGPLAVRAAKMAIDKGSQMDSETALDFERQCYELILGTQDRLEGLKAFAEKRAPVYKGK